MITEEKLKIIATAVNSQPCPLCGGSHRVNISLNSSHSFATSSTDWLVFPSKNRIFFEIEEGACEGFRDRLASFLMQKFPLD